MHPDTLFHRVLRHGGAWEMLFARLDWHTRAQVIEVVRNCAAQALLVGRAAVTRADQAVTTLTQSPRLGALAAETIRQWITRGAA